MKCEEAKKAASTAKLIGEELANHPEYAQLGDQGRLLQEEIERVGRIAIEADRIQTQAIEAATDAVVSSQASKDPTKSTMEFEW